MRLFLRDADGRAARHARQPVPGGAGPGEDAVLFNEFFHGDTGRGLGASHQTGWTGLVALLIQQGFGRTKVSARDDTGAAQDDADAAPAVAGPAAGPAA